MTPDPWHTAVDAAREDPMTRAAGVGPRGPMRRLDPPRLTVGPLSGAIYVVTVGRVYPGPDLHEIVEASTRGKHDVTDQFANLVAEHPSDATVALANELLRLRRMANDGERLRFSRHADAVAKSVIAAAARNGRA